MTEPTNERMNKGKRLHQSEAAAELAPAGVDTLRASREEAEEPPAAAVRAAGRTVGIIGLVFAIASWFIWGLLLGATAAALGYAAYRQGSRTLGIWSMTLGLIAVAAQVVFIPLYYAWF